MNIDPTATNAYVKLPMGGFLVKNLESYKAACFDFFNCNTGDWLPPPKAYPAIAYFSHEKDHGGTIPAGHTVSAEDRYNKLLEEADILRANR